MRRIVLLAALTTFSFLTLSNAQQSAVPPAGSEDSAQTAGGLPVKHVVLYKNGVGYFEHSTRVQGTQDLNIDFTSAQLNDALKSLTVVDLGDGHITGVRFNSVAPLSERLKTLRLPLGEEASRSDLLEALRGTRVEVRIGAAGTTGKLLGIDTRKKFGASAEQMEEVTVLTLVTDAGEVRSFDLGPSTSVRIADRELADEVNRYLNLIGSAKAVDLRRLTISAAGTGEREIFVSYISEVPVWKSTYRILLDAKHAGNPLVQGWAVVDNTIGEDWKDVQLSLVAGAPEAYMKMAPGLVGGISSGGGNAALSGNVKDQSGADIAGTEVTVRNNRTGAMQTATTDSNGKYSFSNLQSGESKVTLSRPGFKDLTNNVRLYSGRAQQFNSVLSVGSVTETVEVTAGTTLTAAQVEDLPLVEPQAEGKSLGDFFEYDLKGKVTIGKNQSALVPILQTRIEAEKVTLWNEDSGQPLRALWLNNTSGLEFDAGSFNILEEGSFAGEGMLAPLRPTEKRLITYAADPSMRIKMVETPTEKPFSRVQIIKGAMIMTKEERETRTFTVSNSDTVSRDVIIEHAIRPEWTLASGTKPEETTPSLQRFRVKVAPQAGAQLVVEEYHPLDTRVELSDVSDDEVTLLTEQKRMTPALQQAIKRVLDQKAVIDKFDEQLRVRQQEDRSITSDQGRIRENMKALKGSVEERALLQRYTHQLDQQEDRLGVLRNQIAELTTQRQQASDQLDKIIAEISLDEKF